MDRLFSLGQHVFFKAIIVGVCALASGCTTPGSEEAYFEPSLNESNAARIVIYRPSSDWMGQAIDFRVMADDKYVGSLDPGSYVSFFAQEGQREITVRPYWMNIPDGRPVSVMLHAEQKATKYLRFAQYVSSVITGPAGMQMQGGTKLQEVSKRDWEVRQ